MSERVDFVIDKGRRFLREISYTDDDGTPIDLTGNTARMQVRPVPLSDELYLELSTETTPPRIVLGGAAGTITLDVADEITDTLNFWEAHHDIVLTDADGNEEEVFEGKVTLNRPVTR